MLEKNFLQAFAGGTRSVHERSIGVTARGSEPLAVSAVTEQIVRYSIPEMEGPFQVKSNALSAAGWQRLWLNYVEESNVLYFCNEKQKVLNSNTRTHGKVVGFVHTT